VIQEDRKLVKPKTFSNRVVLVDGLPGCGKTMLSRILSSLDTVELMSYSYQLEYYCALYHYEKIAKDAVEAVINLEIDQKLYDQAMGRNVNFRISDLSSVFLYADPKEYILRLFSAGDDKALEDVKRKKQILNLAVHNLLPYSEALFGALQDRLLYVHMERHPVYMLKQQMLNFMGYMGSEKDFCLYFKDEKGEVYPHFSSEWGGNFSELKPAEKAILFLAWYSKESSQNKNDNLLRVPFEEFVRKPYVFLSEIMSKLGINCESQLLEFELKRQNVPRSSYSEGIDLDIYKRCGWEKIEDSCDFMAEKEAVFNKIKGEIRRPFMDILNEMSVAYEQRVEI